MLLVCRRCTTRYAVGLDYCPQCTSTDYRIEGEEENVPKVTMHGGASNADEEVPSSPGSSSQASSEKAETSDEPSSPARPRRARTTASHSEKDPEASSAARTTGGSGHGTR